MINSLFFCLKRGSFSFSYSVFRMAEFILEDEKVVTDRITADRIPSNINLGTGNRLKVATNVNYKIK